MNDLINFEFETKQVRTLTDDKNEIWFVAKDVCDILEYSDTQAMTRRLDSDEMRKIATDNLSGANSMAREFTIINESGLYNAILGSKKPNAKAFKKWITSEVIPSIRKTGSYSIQIKAKSNTELLLETVQILVEQEKKLKQIEDDVEKLKEANNKKADIISNFNLPSLPDKSERASINQIVRSYAKNNNLLYDVVYNKLYNEFKYRYSIDLVTRANNKKVSKLDIADELHCLRDLLALAINMFT